MVDVNKATYEGHQLNLLHHSVVWAWGSVVVKALRY
jgi:hypothetical protein